MKRSSLVLLPAIVAVTYMVGAAVPLASGENVISLQQAVTEGKVKAHIRGRGGSTGDTIEIVLQRQVPDLLRISVAVGTVFKSISGNVQNMVAAGVKGEAVSETQYRPAMEIVLADTNRHTYVIEAYSLDFHKPNPGSGDPFGLAPPDDRATNILLAGKKEGASIQAIQSALWIDRNRVADTELKKRFPVRDEDIRDARAILQATQGDAQKPHGTSGKRAPILGQVTVIADEAPIRVGNETKATAKKGEVLDVTAVSDGWYGVVPTKGWIHKQHAKFTPAPASASQASTPALAPQPPEHTPDRDEDMLSKVINDSLQRKGCRLDILRILEKRSVPGGTQFTFWGDYSGRSRGSVSGTLARTELANGNVNWKGKTEETTSDKDSILEIINGALVEQGDRVDAVEIVGVRRVADGTEFTVSGDWSGRSRGLISGTVTKKGASDGKVKWELNLKYTPKHAKPEGPLAQEAPPEQLDKDKDEISEVINDALRPTGDRVDSLRILGKRIVPGGTEFTVSGDSGGRKGAVSGTVTKAEVARGKVEWKLKIRAARGSVSGTIITVTFEEK